MRKATCARIVEGCFRHGDNSKMRVNSANWRDRNITNEAGNWE